MYTIVQVYYKCGSYKFSTVENDHIKQFLKDHLYTWEEEDRLESIRHERRECGSDDLDNLIIWTLEAGKIIIEEQMGFGIVGIINGTENIHTLSLIDRYR